MTVDNEKLNSKLGDVVLSAVAIVVTFGANAFIAKVDPFTVGTVLFFALFVFWTIRINNLRSQRARTTLEEAVLSKKTEP